MSFNDDEPIVGIPEESPGSKHIEFEVGKVKGSVICKKEAPLGETIFKALAQFTGGKASNDRPGVDIVTVLDVSGSMQDDDKLEKLKIAMQFLIRKLSPIDRLSIVSFASTSNRLCPLRQITKDSQPQLENLVRSLVANGGTNITAGLLTALQVLNDRRLSCGRVAAIMLMSDGVQNEGGDATLVPVGNVPVHTFGFGKDYDPVVLNGIANNSKGGTFSIADVDNLSIAFSQCLAGLLTVVVQDLKVTVTPLKARVDNQDTQPKIEKVFAGNYPVSEPDASGSITVSFGDLYAKEVRKLLVNVVLPPVSGRVVTRILHVSYTYSVQGRLLSNPRILVQVRRTGTSTEQEPEEVITEEKRLETTKMMKEARILADCDNLDDAKEKLIEAHSMLSDLVFEEINETHEMLKYEVQHLKWLMKSPELYLTEGRPFALASETSHNRQRFAARGDIDKIRLFATPRMDDYLEQAKAFEKDPWQPVPTADDDVKKELAADPLAPVAGPLSYYLETAIQALLSMQEILNASS